MSRHLLLMRARRPLSLGALVLACGLAWSQPAGAQAASAAAPASRPAAASTPAPKEGPGFWGRFTGRRDDRGGHGDPDRRGMGRHDKGDGADPVERTQQRMAHLKIDLKITAAQEKAWQAYVAQATRTAESVKARQAKQPDREAIQTMSAPDRMAWHTTLLKQRVADEEGMNAAFKTLYGSLTPEQQQLADRELERGHGRGGRHGR